MTNRNGWIVAAMAALSLSLALHTKVQQAVPRQMPVIAKDARLPDSIQPRVQPVYAFNPPQLPVWFETASGWVNNDYPGKNTMIYCVYYDAPSVDPIDHITIPPEQWVTVDISAIMAGLSSPPKAVRLEALCIHTPGSTYEPPGPSGNAGYVILAHFRRTGCGDDPTNPNSGLRPAWLWETSSYYGAGPGYTTPPIPPSGCRDNKTVTLPLVNGQFDMRWWVNAPPQGIYPQYSDYAINLRILELVK